MFRLVRLLRVGNCGSDILGQLEFASHFQYMIKEYIIYSYMYKRRNDIYFNDTLIRMLCKDKSEDRDLPRKNN